MKRSLLSNPLTRTVGGALAAVVVGVGLTTTAFAEGPWDRHHRDGHPLAWSIVMGVLVAAAVGLIVYLVARRTSVPRSSAPAPTASAEAILAERLARGEISPDDYRTLLAALKGDPTPGS